jgi:beta-glucosidase
MMMSAMRVSVSGFVVVLAVSPFCFLYGQSAGVRQPTLGHRGVPVLTIGGLQFKDLNRNGKLDQFEDWRLSPEERADDLVRQLSIADMAGLMVHGTLPAAGGAEASIGRGSGYNAEKSAEFIVDRRIKTFITRLGGDPTKIAEANNEMQEIAEKTGYGIPITVSTDPRNNFLYVPGASVEAGSFSKWPESTGFAAIKDPELTRRFADTVRREYMAVGIREALSPQADLATEPRWARLNGTFGEDADVARAQVEAYVEGMQNGRAGLTPESVVTVVKHWVGYGAQADGWDSHNYYGRYSALTNEELAYHIKPFLGAFEVHVAAVMPTYSILKSVSVNGQPLEQVGAGFSKPLLTDLLRNTYGFKGVVVSDWGITNNCSDSCRDGAPTGQKPGLDQIAMSWGVMEMTRADRFAKAINAGVDQVGGTEDVASLLEAEKSGKLSEARMRESAKRILVQKFAIGLFENPYVDAAAARKTVGNAASLKSGEEAQKRAMVLLENRRNTVPILPGAKVWLFHVSANDAKAHGLVVVDTPAQADVAIIRAETPFEKLHPGYFFGSRQHEGRLNFQLGDPAYDALLQCGKTAAIMTVYMDRPVVLTDVKDKVAALYADFGVSDGALLDVLMGDGKPQGHLPFELPSSMEAVAGQRSDMPHDSVKPLYPYGYALKP